MSETSVPYVVLQEIAELFRPLTVLDSSEGVIGLIQSLGWDFSSQEYFSASFPEYVSAIENIQTALEAFDGLESPSSQLEQVKSLFNSVKAVVTLTGDFPTKLANLLDQSFRENSHILSDLYSRLIDSLIIRYVSMKHPAVQSLALTLGIFDWVYFPADASQYRLETVIPKVHWDRIPKLFSAPTEVADQAYKWLSDFDDELFLSRLFFLLGKLGFSGGTFEQDPKIMAYLRRSSNNNEEYEIPFFQESPADDVLIAGGIRLSGVPANGNLKPGFAIFPYLVGSAGGEIELGNGLVIEITSLIDLEGGASIIFRPPKEITFHTEILSTPTIPANGMLTLALKRLPEPNDFIILFGRPGETRLTLAGFSVLFSIRKTSEAMEVVLEGEAKTVSFVVTSENGDGFLQKCYPRNSSQPLT